MCRSCSFQAETLFEWRTPYPQAIFFIRAGVPCTPAQRPAFGQGSSRSALTDWRSTDLLTPRAGQAYGLAEKVFKRGIGGQFSECLPEGVLEVRLPGTGRTGRTASGVDAQLVQKFSVLDSDGVRRLDMQLFRKVQRQLLRSLALDDHPVLLDDEFL